MGRYTPADDAADTHGSVAHAIYHSHTGRSFTVGSGLDSQTNRYNHTDGEPTLTVSPEDRDERAARRNNA